MQQYNFYQEPSFLDPFLFESESKKESTTTTHKFLEIPHGDASLQFLSPSVLSSFDVGLEQMFQPLIDESSIQLRTN